MNYSDLSTLQIIMLIFGVLALIGAFGQLLQYLTDKANQRRWDKEDEDYNERVRLENINFDTLVTIKEKVSDPRTKSIKELQHIEKANDYFKKVSDFINKDLESRTLRRSESNFLPYNLPSKNKVSKNRPYFRGKRINGTSAICIIKPNDPSSHFYFCIEKYIIPDRNVQRDFFDKLFGVAEDFDQPKFNISYQPASIENANKKGSWSINAHELIVQYSRWKNTIFLYDAFLDIDTKPLQQIPYTRQQIELLINVIDSVKSKVQTSSTHMNTKKAKEIIYFAEKLKDEIIFNPKPEPKQFEKFRKAVYDFGRDLLLDIIKEVLMNKLPI